MLLPRAGNKSSSSQNGDKHAFTGPALYIICAILILIIVNLLLMAVLLVQSRRIDRRLREAMMATHQRARSQSQPIATTENTEPGIIPASRPPRGSFPSIHCPNEEGRNSTTINYRSLSLSTPTSSPTRNSSRPTSHTYDPIPIHPPSPPPQLTSLNARFASLPPQSTPPAHPPPPPPPIIRLSKSSHYNSQTFGFLVEPLAPSDEDHLLAPIIR